MTNKENQKRLDRKKWFESEKLKEDRSGKMDYCVVCGYRVGSSCSCEESNREKSYACATAYNRMVRKNREGK